MAGSAVVYLGLNVGDLLVAEARARLAVPLLAAVAHHELAEVHLVAEAALVFVPLL